MAKLTCIKPRISTLDTRAAREPPKEADRHYLSPEHKEWRARVVARAGGRCEAEGCGRREPRMFADHIVEISDGGARLDLANGQCLCGRCHSLKTAEARTARLNRQI